MPKMVINTCYGGFSLGDAAHRRLARSTSKPTTPSTLATGTRTLESGMESHELEYRSLPALVEVVELLCDEASGSPARSRSWTFPTTPTCRTSRSTTGVSRSGKHRVRRKNFRYRVGVSMPARYLGLQGSQPDQGRRNHEHE